MAEQIVTKVEKWSSKHPFKSPKNIVFLTGGSLREFIDPVSGKRGDSIEDVVSDRTFKSKNYSVQYDAPHDIYKLLIESITDLNAIMISVIKGDFSSVPDYHTRRYEEEARFFLLKDKRVIEMCTTYEKHAALLEFSRKYRLIDFLKNSCGFSLFNQEEQTKYFFKCLSDVFGPVAILGANNIVPFEFMAVNDFISFLKLTEPHDVNEFKNSKVKKYVNAEELAEIECDPLAPNYIVSAERLNSGISVLRCHYNSGKDSQAMYEILRIYFDKNKIASFRRNNFGEWVSFTAKHLSCAMGWTVNKIDKTVAMGNVLEQYLYYLNDIDSGERWAVLVASISYPWFVKLMNSDFAPVLLYSLKDAESSSKKAIMATIYQIYEKGKRPNQILGMNNYQIKYFGDYFKTANSLAAKELIRCVKWVFSDPNSLRYNKTLKKTMKIEMDCVKFNISDIDNETFRCVCNAIISAIDSIFRTEESVELTASCLYFIRTMTNNKNMISKIPSVLSLSSKFIFLSEIKNINPYGLTPTKIALKLYFLYLYARNKILNISRYKQGIESYIGTSYIKSEHTAETFFIDVRHVSKKLKIGFEDGFSKLVEKYNVAIGILATENERNDKRDTDLYGSFFGFAVDRFDFKFAADKKYSKYIYNNKRKEFVVVAPQKTGDVAMEGIVLNNFCKKEIINTAEENAAIFFIRKRKDRATPFYSIKVCNFELVELAGYGGYFPCGNKRLLEFVIKWCRSNKIEPTAITKRMSL